MVFHSSHASLCIVVTITGALAVFLFRFLFLVLFLVARLAVELDEIPADSQCLAFRRARLERR